MSPFSGQRDDGESDGDRTRATLWPYIPQHLIAAQRRGTLPPPGSVQSLYGTLLVADLSGFTHLTEQLQERGRIGAEEVTHIVNRALAPMVDCIDRFSGSIIQFGGDAAYVLFQGAGHRLRGVQAASELMRVLRQSGRMASSIGWLELEMKVVVASGAVTCFHVQTPEQTIHLVAGEAASRLAALAKVVQRGEVLIDADLAATLEIPIGQDARGVLLHGESGPLGAPRKGLAPTGGRLGDQLPRFLPPELRAFLARGPVEGEYRPVASAFIRFGFVEEPPSNAQALELLNQFFTLLTEVLGHYGGLQLKNDMGPLCNSLLAVFGLPEPHEDDAPRALLAALSLRDRVREELPSMRVRTALNFGMVVAADIGGSNRRTYDVMGDGVNLTARILERTPDGEIWVTRSAALLAEGAVRLEPLGTHSFRGKDVPVELMRAVERRESPVSPGTRKVPPIVGREQEIEVVRGLLGDLEAGRGSVLSIQGEAGSGKSRLWYEIRSILRQRDLPFCYGACPSYGGLEGYTVFADLFRRMAGIDDGCSRAEALERARSFAAYGLTAREIAHLESIMGLRSRIDIGRGAELRAGNFQTVRTLVRVLAGRGPLAIVLEDLQWVDPTSAELIAQLAFDAAELPILIVLIHRPPLDLRVETLPWFREVVLRPLPVTAGTRLLETLLGGPVSTPLSKRLVERSGGVPFFLEELTRAVREQGLLERGPEGWALAAGADPESLPLPDSLDAVLSARLHRLPPSVKRVAQRAAVIGRTFSYRLLQSVCDEDISAAIQSLRTREIVFELPPGRGGDGSDQELIFKHALTREVAYFSLLERTRQRLHGEVARVLQAELGDEVERNPERVAWHLAASSAPEEAVPHLLTAARKALSQGRFVDGRREAARAIAILDQLPGRDYGGLRFPLLLCLGDAVAWAGRYQDVLDIYDDAAGVAPDDGARAEVHGRRAYIHWANGELEQARRSAEDGLAIALHAGTVAGQTRCLRELGRSLREVGNLRASAWRFEQALELSASQGDRIGEAMALRGLGATRVEQGRFAEAEGGLLGGLQLAGGLGDRRGEVEALFWLGRLAMHRGELELARTRLTRAGEAALELGDVSSAVLALCAQLELDVLTREVAMARDRLDQATELASRVKVWRTRATLLTSAAMVALQDGDSNEAGRMAAEALTGCIDRGDVHGGLPALHVLLEGALQAGDQADARERSDLAQRWLIRGEAPVLAVGLYALEGLLRSAEGRRDWEPPLFEALEASRRMGLTQAELVTCERYAQALRTSHDSARAREMEAKADALARARGRPKRR